MPRFELWRRVLLALSALFAAQAAGWALLGSFDPFGFYEGHMARALWGADALPADARRAFAFTLVPFGATTAGFFVLVFLVVRHAFPQREPWAWRAVGAGIGTWFALDTALCAAHGAWFNVLLVNLPCLALLVPPLLALRPYFGSGAAHPDV
jgi:hypothetical protein